MSELNRRVCIDAIELVCRLLQAYGSHELADELRDKGVLALEYIYPSEDSE